MPRLSRESSSTLRQAAELWELTAGRLCEVSGAGGGGGLTLAASFLCRAQAERKSYLWLSSELKPFYPPDLQAHGVCLKQLPVLFLPRPDDALKAMIKLVSSGGFDLVICDLASWKDASFLATGMLVRLSALARHHRASLLLLTAKPHSFPSLGCSIGLRLGIEADESSPSLLRLRVLKDKRGAVGEGKEWSWRCSLPEGLSDEALLPSDSLSTPLT